MEQKTPYNSYEKLTEYNFNTNINIDDLASKQGSEAISPHIANDLASKQGSDAISPHIVDDVIIGKIFPENNVTVSTVSHDSKCGKNLRSVTDNSDELSQKRRRLN